MENDGKPKRHEFLVINDEEETPSLLNPMSGEVFVTNHVGKRIMELADGTVGVDAIVDDIAKSFKGTSTEMIRQDVSSFLSESASRGLIAWV